MRTIIFILLGTLAWSDASFAKTRDFGVIKTKMSDVHLWDGPGRAENDTQFLIHRLEEVYVTGPAKVLPNGENWLPVRVRRMNEDGKFEQPAGWVDSKFFTKLDDDGDDQTEAASSPTCKKCGPRSGLAPLPGGVAGRAKSSKGFIWPVSGQLRSGFGMRFHPILGRYIKHKGIDLAGNNRKPVVAAKAGKIKKVRGGCREALRGPAQLCNGRAGNYVVIDHGDGTETNYMHLSPTCKLPPEGSRVQQNQVIGCVGMSGGATGPHLHFGVKVHGVDVNPLLYLPRTR